MTAAAVHAPTLAARRVPEFRYGVVMLIVLALVMFEIVAPDADWARVILVALAGSALIVAYSFTVFTTTGFGDYTAAHPVGHALAVLEMLTDQLYLVTVISVMIGHYVSRRK